MKGPQVDHIVYECMFPKPKNTEPSNFQQLLQRNLVPEVRLETQAFYGHLSSQEAKYPGLDYSYQPHRVRLSRYTWHRRLFRAFDNLGLTKSEIAGLTKWEGTRWAKERFEREQGIVIRDTTADGICDWVPPELRVAGTAQAQRADIEDMEDIQEDGEMEENDNENEHDNEMEEDGEESDVGFQSVGNELNERLRAAVALREAGNMTIPIDEEWEQWLKDAVEAGNLPYLPPDLSPNANIPGTRPAGSPQTLLDAARDGQWQQIPDFLHSFVRQNIEARGPEGAIATPSPPPPASSTASSSSSSPFLNRPSLRPVTRTPPRNTATNNRLFAEAFSRRPIPPLPSVGSTSRTSTLRIPSRNPSGASSSRQNGEIA